MTTTQPAAEQRCAPTVLLAEDDPDLRELYIYALRRAGFRVTAVPDGLEALAQLNHQRFDLVLLDRAMPRADGITVLRELRRSHDPDIPAIMISHMTRSADIVTGYAAGANSYLSKDTGVQTIIEEAHFLVRTRRLAGTKSEGPFEQEVAGEGVML